MVRFFPASLLSLLTALTICGCVLDSKTNLTSSDRASSVEGFGSLGKLPFKEAWYGTYFQEDKVGFSHFQILPSGRNYKLLNESLMRLKVLKKTNEVSMKERIVVRPDLTLVSFDSRVRMEGKDLKMTGRVEGDSFLVDIVVEGEKLTRTHPLKGRKFYHSSALSLYPALHGIGDGKHYSFVVFNPQNQAMAEVSQKITRVAGDPGPNDAVWKVSTSFGPAKVLAWLNRKGLTVLEKHHGGSLITMLEDKKTQERFREGKVSQKDLVLDFSLIRVSKPIPNPGKVRYLKVKIDGISPELIPDDTRQRKLSAKGGFFGEGFDVEVRARGPETGGTDDKEGAGRLQEELASTMTIQSNHPEIVSQVNKIVSRKDTDLQKVNKLVKWTSKNIKNTIKDSFTALSVLRTREGECQSHANLYTAFARALKIPTRVVTGLVYTEDVGFLYHAWAESYVNGWLAVDPTLNQVPADATHIKISTGNSSADVSKLLKIVGKVKMKVLEFK